MFLNVIISLVILLIAFFAIRFVWTNTIDFKEWFKSKLPKVPTKNEAPKIEYGFHSNIATYNVDQTIDGVLWRENYSKHLLTLVNNSDQNISNIILSIHFPGAIVNNKIESRVNTFDVNFSQYNQPITIGNDSTGKVKLENVIQCRLVKKMS